MLSNNLIKQLLCAVLSAIIEQGSIYKLQQQLVAPLKTANKQTKHHFIIEY